MDWRLERCQRSAPFYRCALLFERTHPTFSRGCGTKVRSRNKKGLVQFKLLPFTDTLRASPGLQSFRLIIMDHKSKEIIASSVLFRVRTAWTVEDITFRQKVKMGMRHLAISWKDLGKAQGRVLRFWDKNRPWLEPVMQSFIPDGASEMNITVKAEELPEGPYVLEYAVIGPGAQVIPSWFFPEMSPILLQ